ncbi:MAG: PaaI family thioesterase [Sphingomonadales bacterium]|nr:PaaI family thioesterase [Sphingomonadales bacterium]MBD3773437.1 PaaI family thioesterase [Paracoccaceae bacterium]
MSEYSEPMFDPQRPRLISIGHTGWLGCRFRDAGPDWVEIDLPWREDLVGDPASGTFASGPIVSMMDTACSLGAWRKIGHFHPQVTLDLRVDYMRPSHRGATLVGRGECYRLTRSVAFVRGIAHDGDPADPVAHVAGSFMRLGKPRI